MRIALPIAVLLLLGLAACRIGTSGGGATPTPTPTPAADATRYGPGTYRVGSDIQPGIYAGRAGTAALESCYWERLRGASGELADIIANDNAYGQFYVEVLATDVFFKIRRCTLVALADWPRPPAPLTRIGAGTYLVGRDVAAGRYRGDTATEDRTSCYWARLKRVTGRLADIHANDNATGQFFVEVLPTDYALETRCSLTRTSG